MSRRRSLGRSALARFLRPDELITSEGGCRAYAGDKWFASALPDAVVLPRSVAVISKVLAYAHRYEIPVTARGAGYGYVGGCVPLRGGIVLSTERMNRIKEISTHDFVGVVEPGVITAEFQSQVEKKGLYYPLDPASRADCSLGGNIATNAGGPRCLKYGVTRDYVLGLEVVMADGSVTRLGGRCHKNKTGFDLHRLFVGSEGLLGVITEATLKLLPQPPFRACLSMGFPSMKVAAKTIRLIFAKGFLPAAVEVADKFTLAAGAKRTGSRLFAGCQAHVIVEIDGQERSVRSDMRSLERALKTLEPIFIRRGYGESECEAIWKVRREFSFALRDTGLTKLNQDVVVPRGRLEGLFSFAACLQKKHGIQVACFGHAGDGNIHVNVMVDRTDPDQEARSQRVVDELFQQVLEWGGAVTGEHGIGVARLPWWDLATSENVRRMHRLVKEALDPKRILNPEKFV
ncbi:MAG: putative FAD-linked oxidoreductase [Verrucomicrobia subdivision 3 bacterium]|nr:putative FAD-linked oxidoreductase [Limisphaerales bacterium]MCS1417319.1 putative FAD-linked oxidoreductase [Limisphaerales bacterium]